MTFGSWNVRTLLDLSTNNPDRPERLTALVTKELARFNIDIAALSETRFSGEGKMDEVGSGYTIFWKGREEGERRLHGFAIKTTLIRMHQLTPTAISERLMALRLPLPQNNFITVLSAYTPTLDADEDVKNQFYDRLSATIYSVPSRDKLLLLDDFNARVGRDHHLWENIIGKEGVGLLLLGLCAEQALTITNTLFRMPNRFKTTWRHPRSKHWHLLDYAIIRQPDRKDVLVTRTKPSADDCWTDHRLLITRLRISIRSKPKVNHHLVQK